MKQREANGKLIEQLKERMRALPAMDTLLAQEWVEEWNTELGRGTVKSLFSEMLAQIRRDILEDKRFDTSREAINERALKIFRRESRRKLRPVVNATGVVIHTNMGRSCLSEEAVEAVKGISASYSTLEYDLEAGARGSRNSLIESLLCRATGAEAAIVVNNNAAAVVLCLSALARGREVIVSRGELVEIGGSFRIPDIMEFSGAKLVEVGTTNRTHNKDYKNAITSETAMLLKVHPSNFRIEGFTASVPREELAAIAHDSGLPLMEDAGSGLLLDCGTLGLEGEDTVRRSLEDGADLVTFSGDKMLGGPQIGAIVGKKSIVDKLRGAQILRALRVDKMTLAAFEATLRIYLRGDSSKIPVINMLTRTDDELKAKAEAFAGALREKFGERAKFNVIRVDDAVGGGSYPAKALDGWGVAVTSHGFADGTTGSLAAALRVGEIPVVAGARDNALVFHVRTLLAGDEARIIKAMESI